MPGNRAVAYGNDISYQIVEVVDPNEGSLCEKDDVLVIADDLADDVIEAIGAGETALRASRWDRNGRNSHRTSDGWSWL